MKEKRPLASVMCAKRKQREGGTRCSFPGRVPGIRRRRRVMFYLFHCCIRRATSAVHRIFTKKQKRPGTRPNRSVWQAIYFCKRGTMISFQIAFVIYTGVKAVGSVKFNNSPVLAIVDHTNLASRPFFGVF